MGQVKLMIGGLIVLGINLGICAQTTQSGVEFDAKAKELMEELKLSKLRIIHETYQEGNWELVIRNADGSNPINITNTPQIDEMFAHVSPDGTKVVYLEEHRQRRGRTRDVYYMNIDGTGRVMVGRNGREPFWSPDGKIIGFCGGTRDYHRGGLLENELLHFYHIETGQYYTHPNEEIAGLLNPCWSPDGRWIITSVYNAMGFGESILALQADGMGVVELRRSTWEADDIYQCRPDISADGKHVAWGKEDKEDYMAVEVGDINLSGFEPEVFNLRYVVTVPYPLEIYHVDWSPDGKYIAYSQGRRGNRMASADFVIGTMARGWDLWVVKPSEPGVAVQITHDGLSNKEPDWFLPVEKAAPQEQALKEQLKAYKHKIIHESYQNGNWDLFIRRADGTEKINLTNTADIDELYPQVSPDGKRIVFCADVGQGYKKTRSVYYMNIDGGGRVKVADNGRQPCWNPDGTKIAYLKGKDNYFNYSDFATRGLYIYDLKTKTHNQHPNKELSNLYNLCWHPEGKWFFATVHAGMGYSQAILAIEAEGDKVYDMEIGGGRADISHDGKQIAWGASDMELKMGDLDLSSTKPKVINIKTIAETTEPVHIYHADFSPDGKYVVFSHGPAAKKMRYALETVGIEAKGWDIGIADLSQKNVWIKISDDGLSNKEPDWVFAEVQDK